mgnify:FL=1
MAQVFLLDIENRKGITIYNENNNPSDLTIFPNVKRRPNGSLLIYVIPSNTGRRLEWLYAKDNSGKIIDYRQFKINSTENNNNNNNNNNETTIKETYELEISVRHIPQHAVKQNGNKLNIEPLVTEIVPYAVWSGENVYQGKICENLTTEEAELKEMVEWAKKELSSET